MADFETAFDYMIQNEDPGLTGKIVTDNNGALVRYGLNQTFNSNLDPTFYSSMPNDEALPLAKTQYTNRYWSRIKGEDILIQRVASKVLDMAVNMGVEEGSKLLQRSVNVDDDGIIGPATLNATNSQDALTTLDNIVMWWNWFILEEIKAHPADAEYVRVWKTRANKLP